MAFGTDCETCEAKEGQVQNEILSVHLQEIDIELSILDLNIEVCPICIRIFTAGDPTALTDAQKSMINAYLQFLRSMIPPDLV